MRRSLLGLALFALFVTALAGCNPDDLPAPFALHVRGAQFENQRGEVVQLRGVNRTMDFPCTQMNQYITDPWIAGGGGPNEGKTIEYADKVARAFLTWDAAGKAGHAINTVRLTLNEDCWLGINGAPAAYSGANYQLFVRRLAVNLTAGGMFVVLALHWAAPGSWLPGRDENGSISPPAANGQNLAPDKDHSVEFWRQVTAAFSQAGNVAFDLFTEPGIHCTTAAGCPAGVAADYAKSDAWAWNLYRYGGSYTYSADDGAMYASRVGQTWQVAGTQELLDTIRAEEDSSARPPAPVVRHVVIVETLGWGNGLMDMMGANLPVDKFGQVAASIHTYDFSGFTFGDADHQAKLEAQLSTGLNPDYSHNPTNVLGVVPLYVGEFGTNGQCGAGGVDEAWLKASMDRMDQRGVSYTAWGWDSGEGCWGPAIVANFQGNDTGAPAFGGFVIRDHLQARQSVVA